MRCKKGLHLLEKVDGSFTDIVAVFATVIYPIFISPVTKVVVKYNKIYSQIEWPFLLLNVATVAMIL